jgi:hypothetical protein
MQEMLLNKGGNTMKKLLVVCVLMLTVTALIAQSQLKQTTLETVDRRMVNEEINHGGHGERKRKIFLPSLCLCACGLKSEVWGSFSEGSNMKRLVISG